MLLPFRTRVISAPAAEWGRRVQARLADYIDAREVDALLQFMMGQLRTECERAGYADAFDAEFGPLAPRTTTTTTTFLPFHTALGDHERFVHEVIYARNARLTAEQRICLAFAFRATCCADLFEAVFGDALARNEAGEPASLDALLLMSSDAFRRDGPVHRAFAAHRAAGGKLHTAAFSCHPPRGAKGEEYTVFMVTRTAQYIGIGYRVHAMLEPSLDGAAPPPTMSELDATLQREHRVGPTTSRMLMVTVHLSFPHLGLLSDHCQVGDGAAAGLSRLLPCVSASVLRHGAARQAIFHAVYAHVRAHQGPRLARMIAWTADVAREKYAFISPASIARSLSAYDLQVSLSEWRRCTRSV